MNNKIRNGGVALALLIIVSVFGSTIRATARAGPLIRIQTNTPLPSPSSTPSPSPSETPTQTPTKTPKPENVTPTPWGIDWDINCDNDDPYDGFRLPPFARDYCVPGVITYDTWTCRSTGNFHGVLSSYSDGIMEYMEDKAGVPRGQGITLMSCGDLGRTVWIRPQGMDWVGPFTVVDCAMPEHAYYNIVALGLAAEIGYTTTKELGILASPYVEVHIGSGKPSDFDGANYRWWWMTNCMEFEAGGDPITD